MSIYIYTYICMYKYAYIHICMYTFMHIYISVDPHAGGVSEIHIYAYMHIYMYTDMSIWELPKIRDPNVVP